MTIAVGHAQPAVLKVLSDPTRWRIVERLAAEELCVCHLAEDLGLAQPLVSHHLRTLRAAGLVTSERYRQWTYYRLLRDPLAAAVAPLQAIATSASGERRPCC